MKRTYAALALISLAFVAPEAWEAYAIQSFTQECPEVEVTCRCEVDVAEEEQKVEMPSQTGARVGVPYE